MMLLNAMVYSQGLLKGLVLDEKLKPIPYATVALLEPKDSTLLFFGIADLDGSFQIKNIVNGSYLLQASYLGYETFYKKLELNKENENNNLNIALKAKSKTLKEVDVEADRIPIQFKKDTVEYDAAAYKTKPDAVAEDLLKKLPGVEVDRAGNVKAMGEKVNTVLVDGKEFFSNDPKVATKNLPVDAIKKVQVYDRKSEEEELSGMSDGSTNQTINIILKDNKKKAYFGDVQGGYGTDNRYQGSIKAYRFTKKTQFAALGMVNNINQFGFSFQDYLSFSGGLRNFGEGGFNVDLGDPSSTPINFGQQVNGLLNSGSLGLNYTNEYASGKRFNISYMGNQVNRDLKEKVYSLNYLENLNFERNANNSTDATNYSQSLNLTWRNKIDSNQNLVSSANAQFNNANSKQSNYSNNKQNNQLINDLLSVIKTESDDYAYGAKSNYVRRFNSKWRMMRLGADVSLKNANNFTVWDNNSNIYASGLNFIDIRNQDIRNTQLKQQYNIGFTRYLFGSYYINLGMAVGSNSEDLKRRQNNLIGSESLVDSLSPDFSRTYNYYKPNIAFKYNTTKLVINADLKYEFAEQKSNFKDSIKLTNNFLYFTPSFEFEYEYKKGRRFIFQTNTRVNPASANQLLPILNNTNSVVYSRGNQELKPELARDYRLMWILFDQFSFVSWFNSLNFTQTSDKINWNRTIDSNLVQYLKAENVRTDYRLNASSEFSTPIRKLKINTSIELSESWNRGINYINNRENISNTYTHEITWRIDNRKKEKVDVSIGTTFSFNQAFYSIQNSLNNTYTNQVYFIDANYKPNDKWYFGFNADISNYNSQSFNQSLSVPLLKAEMTRYFLKNNRASFTVSVFDILNKNTGIVRNADQTGIQEVTSNIIGRYVLFNLKFRLNQFGEQNSGVKIDIRK